MGFIEEIAGACGFDPVCAIGFVWDSLTMIFKYALGVILLLISILALALLNIALGINIGQMVVSTVVFLLTTLVEFWKTIVNTFKFDNKEQITALAVILFILMIFGFMAFNLNAFGSAGKISVGSGEVSANAEGQQGSGSFFNNGATPTTTGTSNTITSTTQPHCFNGVKDGDETDVDCGGDCTPCHCFNGTQDQGENDTDCDGGCYPCHCKNFIKDYTETGTDCGGDCVPCSCSPIGVNPDCFRGSSESGIRYIPYCCDVGEQCVNHCSNVALDNIPDIQFYCGGDTCIGI